MDKRMLIFAMALGSALIVLFLLGLALRGRNIKRFRDRQRLNEDLYRFVVLIVTSLAMFYALHALGMLRVSTVGELQGLDLHEHGIPAYPEYALHASAAPQGTPEFTAAAFGSEPRVVMSQKMANT